MVEKIVHDSKILAMIIHSNAFDKEGITFFTPDEYSQQVAFMKHPEGKKIEPHVHNKIERQVFYTQEVLYIKKGKLKVDFYNEEQEYLESRIIAEGELLLLAAGGHGMEVLEDLEMFEIKQGPYAGEADKIRFVPKERR